MLHWTHTLPALVSLREPTKRIASRSVWPTAPRSTWPCSPPPPVHLVHTWIHLNHPKSGISKPHIWNPYNSPTTPPGGRETRVGRNSHLPPFPSPGVSDISWPSHSKAKDRSHEMKRSSRPDPGHDARTVDGGRGVAPLAAVRLAPVGPEGI